MPFLKLVPNHICDIPDTDVIGGCTGNNEFGVGSIWKCSGCDREYKLVDVFLLDMWAWKLIYPTFKTRFMTWTTGGNK